MGAPVGNKNAVKNTPWSDAIRRALLAKNGQKLRQLADKLVSEALSGNVTALKEIGDRVEGRSVTVVEMSGPDGGPIKTEDVSNMELAKWMAFTLRQTATQMQKGTS